MNKDNNTNEKRDKVLKNKKLLTNIFLFGAFPVMCVIFALIGRWILFGIALTVYFLVFIYIKMENFRLISTGYYDKKGEYIKALKPAYKAYKMKKSSIDTANIFIYILLKSGRYEKALEICQANQDREMNEDQHIAFYSNKALTLWKLGNVEEAVGIFEDITKEYESTSIYVSYGTVLTFSNDLNKALELNKKAYQYNSSSKGIKDNLAYTYFLLGDKDRAKRMYDELLDEPVNFPEAYYNAALVTHSQGQDEEAVRLFKQALTKQFTGLTAVTRAEIQTKIDYLNRGQGGML